MALQNTLAAQQNDKNILLVLAAGKFAFFSSLSIILMYFIIIRLISSFVFSCSFLCIAHQALRGIVEYLLSSTNSSDVSFR